MSEKLFEPMPLPRLSPEELYTALQHALKVLGTSLPESNGRPELGLQAEVDTPKFGPVKVTDALSADAHTAFTPLQLEQPDVSHLLEAGNPILMVEFFASSRSDHQTPIWYTFARPIDIRDKTFQRGIYAGAVKNSPIQPNEKEVVIMNEEGKIVHEPTFDPLLQDLAVGLKS